MKITKTDGLITFMPETKKESDKINSEFNKEWDAHWEDAHFIEEEEQYPPACQDEDTCYICEHRYDCKSYKAKREPIF